jgi:hypothetical protein
MFANEANLELTHIPNVDLSDIFTLIENNPLSYVKLRYCYVQTYCIYVKDNSIYFSVKNRYMDRWIDYKWDSKTNILIKNDFEETEEEIAIKGNFIEIHITT